MKKILGFLVICIFIFAGVSFALKISHERSSPAPAVTISSQSQPTTPTTIHNTSVPKELLIPVINIDAQVESVGLDAQKRMDVPHRNEDVGWYNLGFKPGERGSVVVDGHLDTVTGAPAVFWNLKKLHMGDKILLKDSDSKSYTYKVANVVTYAFDKVPLQAIFASTDKARLNLVTCGGTWDQLNKNYSNRTVVYSEMVE